MNIALVSCVSKKLEITIGELIQAKDLYISSLFKMANAYAENLNVDKI